MDEKVKRTYRVMLGNGGFLIADDRFNRLDVFIFKYDDSSNNYRTVYLLRSFPFESKIRYPLLKLLK